MKAILRRCVLIAIAWVFLHCWWITFRGLQAFRGKADVAIVLGNAVLTDGTLSPWLQGRVEAALALYRNGQVKKIFVSGGIGKSGFPEGDGMRNYLVQHGVPAGDIIVDNAGSNTYLTALHFKELCRRQPFHSAVVVTSFYHVARSRYIVHKLGCKQVSGAHSTAYFWNDWFGMLREVVAFYKYWLVY